MRTLHIDATYRRTLLTMPANLPPEYYKLKHQLEAAKTDDERLQLMEEMLRITPKHKGSEKVVSDLRRRIAKLRNAPDKKGGTKRHSHHIPKQGAGTDRATRGAERRKIAVSGELHQRQT